ncbi:hypothetical protein BMS97_09220 [Leuconostoc mesenteroides subsp. mesenteroides]|uniref:hypothetical protein n=1 Tax=Leuconostoc mesenteroides TaxID=1245 RepID=UPI000A03771F|nr:hypothetical protein [Leuconostoc mesenteroides]ARN62843.1 hypothetical protein A0F18_01895 [Leuconostoc mesenteroides subsp. mesenteroides]MDV8928355.1 hypothetical protein [Leuconostoc mesenteroides]ORI88668.1 hypothetical protein BMS97_09220 [Leuconostoc mesenteroides subsp. mesenteroides]ORI91537.1 hypothetical protein BMS98_08925 [Leuconostoc mesenteroides subsp. mesenteroides]
MVARSMSIRKVDTFEIPTDIDVLAKGNGARIGAISACESSLTIEKHTLKEYIASYEETITETITVYDESAEDYFSYNQYLKNRTFKIFFDEKTHTLYSSAPSIITHKFLNHLSKNDTADVSGIHSLAFDFDSVANQLIVTKLIRFDTDDDHVHKKTFGGDDVAKNIEAIDALDNDATIQLIGKLRVGQSDYTISISKPGTLVVYTRIDTPTKDRPEPMLEFTIRVLDELKINELKV